MEYGLQTFQNSFGLLFVFKIIFTALTVLCYSLWAKKTIYLNFDFKYLLELSITQLDCVV